MNSFTQFDSEDYRKFVRRNGTWNFWVNVGDLSFFHLASSFVFITTIIPLYVSHLTESRVLIGLIPAVSAMCYYLPQIFTAAHTESLSRKKPWVLRISTLERLPFLVLGAAVLLWPVAPPYFSYALLLMMLVVTHGAAGVCSPAWMSMLAAIIHPKLKGAMFGLGTAIGALMGAAGALWAHYILDTFPFPISFGLCFLIAFFFQMFSYCCLSLIREPALPVDHRRKPFSSYFRELPTILRQDKNFLYFLISQWFAIFGMLAVTFYVLYGQETFVLSDSFAATITLVALVSQAIGTPIIGRLGDYFGHRFATMVSILLSAAAGMVIVVAPNLVWLLVSFSLLSVSNSGLQISRPLLTIELGSSGRLPTYLALTNTLLAIPTLAAPIIGGWLIELVNFKPVFVTGIVFSLLSWMIMQFFVKEPRNN